MFKSSKAFQIESSLIILLIIVIFYQSNSFYIQRYSKQSIRCIQTNLQHTWKIEKRNSMHNFRMKALSNVKVGDVVIAEVEDFTGTMKEPTVSFSVNTSIIL